MTRLTVCVYDVRSDARRRKLHALLKQYGVPIQKSAFEARLSEAERRRLIARARRLVDEKTDRFVVYVVAASQEAQIACIGEPRPKIVVEEWFVI